MLWVTDAKYVADYRVWLALSDGIAGEIDLYGRLCGEVFEPLKDVSLFQQVRFEPDMDTIVWPNGANLAPEYLRDEILRQGHRVTRQKESADRSDYDDDCILHVTAAKYLGGYRVWIEFSDGTSGEADLSASLRGPVFEPLKDIALFGQVKFNPEMDTIVWPNGADLAPEYLKELVIQQSVVTAKAS
jgi:uncharacterized protein DUF2442